MAVVGCPWVSRGFAWAPMGAKAPKAAVAHGKKIPFGDLSGAGPEVYIKSTSLLDIFEVTYLTELKPIHIPVFYFSYSILL